MARIRRNRSRNRYILYRLLNHCTPLNTNRLLVISAIIVIVSVIIQDQFKPFTLFASFVLRPDMMFRPGFQKGAIFSLKNVSDLGSYFLMTSILSLLNNSDLSSYFF